MKLENTSKDECEVPNKRPMSVAKVKFLVLKYIQNLNKFKREFQRLASNTKRKTLQRYNQRPQIILHNQISPSTNNI